MRLIDADKLMYSLRGNVLIDVVPELEETIAQQPTAFDKEKVIDRLKISMSSVQEISGQAVTFGFADGYYNGIKDAIEIVEKGGIE